MKFDLKNISKFERIGLALILVPIIYYFYILIKYTVNVPFSDEYDALLGFILYVQDPYVTYDQVLWRMFLGFGNEHRMLLLDVTLLVSRYLLGGLNFFWLSMFGNLCYLLLFWILTKEFIKRNTFLVLVPTTFVFFMIQAMGSMSWAMTALEHSWVMLFGVLAIIAATKRNLWMVTLYAFLAMMSFGNGLLLIPIIGLIFALQKAWKRVAAFVGISTALVVFYFWDVQNMGSEVSIVQNILSFPIEILKHYLTLLGTPFVAVSQHAIFSGILVAIAFLIITWRRAMLRQPVLYYSLFFLLLSLFIASCSRFDQGVEQAISPRYKSFSVVAMAILTLLLTLEFKIPKTWQRSIYTVIILGCMYINYAELAPIKEQSAMLMDHMQSVIAKEEVTPETHDFHKFYKEKSTFFEENLLASILYGFYDPGVHVDLIGRSIDFDPSLIPSSKDSLLWCTPLELTLGRGHVFNKIERVTVLPKISVEDISDNFKKPLKTVGIYRLSIVGKTKQAYFTLSPKEIKFDYRIDALRYNSDSLSFWGWIKVFGTDQKQIIKSLVIAEAHRVTEIFPRPYRGDLDLPDPDNALTNPGYAGFSLDTILDYKPGPGALYFLKVNRAGSDEPLMMHHIDWTGELSD